MKTTITPPRIGAPLCGEPHPVLQWIEVASFLQIPGFQIIGLPAPEVSEARERVRAAIEASGIAFPRRRVVVNLSPASIRKRGTGADLAVALAVLVESHGVGRRATAKKVVAWGELGLDGSLKPAGQITRAVFAAWEAGADLLILPALEVDLALEKMALLEESGLLKNLPPPQIAAAKNLEESWEILGAESHLTPALPAQDTPPLKATPNTAHLLSLTQSMERILGVATAGLHHVLLLGPRGSGKSHAHEWLIALQREVPARIRAQQELLSELSGQSAGGLPYRRVGPQASPEALLGCVVQDQVRPGEFTLADGGLLLADEFPEWKRDSRETLREPLERGVVTLTRARKSTELPARFMFAGSGNFCPCGGWPREIPPPADFSVEKLAPCKCTNRARLLYLARLSGPVLDRLDLVALSTPREEEMSDLPSPSERLQVLRDRAAEAQRKLVLTWGLPPAHLPAAELEEILRRRPTWRKHLARAKLQSLRARHKVLRVALTLSAWDGKEEPESTHFSEASYYRPERIMSLLG